MHAIRHTQVMGEVLQLMTELGYIDGPPGHHYRCLTFLDDAVAALGEAVLAEYPARTGLQPTILPVSAADGAGALA